MKMYTTCLLLTMSATLMLAGIGCGSGEVDRGPVGEVSGTVTFKGEALKEGSVRFVNAQTGAAAGSEIGEDGKYMITTEYGGLPVGSYKVSLAPPTEEKQTSPDSPPSEVEKEMPNMPKKYRDQDKTPLTFEVKEGANTYDVKMEE